MWTLGVFKQVFKT